MNSKKHNARFSEQATPKPIDLASPDEEAVSGSVPSLLSRRQMLQGSAALAAVSIIPGVACAATARGAAAGGVLTNPQPTPSGMIESATMSIVRTPIGRIPPFFNGLSFEKKMSATNAFARWNPDLINLFTRLGTGVVRFGGVTVDHNVWSPGGPGGQGSNSSGLISEPDVNRVRDFCEATGWKCYWGVSLKGSSGNPTTSTLAAQEAAYVADQLGSNLLGIEIGNEPESYGITQSAYATLWKQFRDAIVGMTPGIPISGPVSAGISWANWFANSSGYGGLVQTLSDHYYRASSGTPPLTVANFVNPEPDTTLASVLSNLASDSANNNNVPFRLAECNSSTGGGVQNVSNGYAAALWGPEFLMQLAKAKAAGANFHGGATTMWYSPITMYDGGTIHDVWPLYYGMYLFQMVGTGTVYSSTFSGNPYTRAYSVSGSGSPQKILVVNTDSSHNLQLTISLYGTVTAASLIEMTQLTSGASGPDLSATSGVTIQGGTVGTDGSYTPNAPYDLNFSGSTVTCYVPFLSACLITVTLSL